jgi:pilus assembly protein CpaB
MATGQRAVNDPKTGERKTYSTVTLDADPTQARNIIVARDAGRITALLRNPQDSAGARFSQRDLSELLGNALRPGASEIPVLYGGRSGKLSPEALNLARPAKSESSNPDGDLAPLSPISASVSP